MNAQLARQHPARCVLAVCLCAAVLLAVGCDEDVEKQIGSMTAASVESEYTVVSDPLLSGWIQNTGQTLAGYSTRQSVPYSFKVIDTDMVNAFAAPYGYVYVTTGLLDFADSEDEIWGVVGHEIGHVVRRHGMSQLKRGFLYDLGVTLLGTQSETIADIAGIGLGLLSLRYSREDEYEADDMGRVLSFSAGYDPNGNVRFFQKLMEKYETRRPSSIEVMFRTHPPTERRITRQLAMPELSDTNPETMLLVGRGYARRFQTRRASEMLASAAGISQKDPTLLTALGDVRLARGEYAEAQVAYQAAASLQPTAYTEQAIALASAGSPTMLAEASSADRARAGVALSDAQAVARQSGIVIAQAQRTDTTVASSLAPTVEGAHSIIDSLFSLAETDASVKGVAQKALTYANGVANQAITPVYTVEIHREKLLAAAREAEAVSNTLVAKLQAARDGRLPAEDIPVLLRTLDDNRRLLADIRKALDQLQDAEPVVVAAEASARQTTSLIERVMKGDVSNQAAAALERSAQTTEAAALTALAATNEARETSQTASTRALVARINSAAIGVSSAARGNLDGMVAHYLLSTPRQVRQVRGKGLGYGDAALIMAASMVAKTSPEQMASSVPAARSVVDHIDSIGARSDGAMIMMKYLADAMDYETAQ